jgi:hypothetical protein
MSSSWNRIVVRETLDIIVRLCLSKDTTGKMISWMNTQIDEYGYPYFHRKFASYGAVNGSYFFIISGTEIRCRLRCRIFNVYGRKDAVASLCTARIVQLGYCYRSVQNWLLCSMFSFSLAALTCVILCKQLVRFIEINISLVFHELTNIYLKSNQTKF